MCVEADASKCLILAAAYITKQCLFFPSLTIILLITSISYTVRLIKIFHIACFSHRRMSAEGVFFYFFFFFSCFMFGQDEEGIAVCKYCGYCSSNFEVCEGCNRKLPPDVKVVIKKRKLEGSDSGPDRERTCGGGKMNASPTTNGPTMSKRTFYGNKLQTQNTAFTGKVGDLTNDFVIKNTGRSFPRRRGSGVPRIGGRGKKSKEPGELACFVS